MVEIGMLFRQVFDLYICRGLGWVNSTTQLNDKAASFKDCYMLFLAKSPSLMDVSMRMRWNSTSCHS